VAEAIAKETPKTPGLVPLYEEKGTYSGYVHLGSGARSAAPAGAEKETSRALCPVGSGGPGQPNEA